MIAGCGEVPNTQMGTDTYTGWAKNMPTACRIRSSMAPLKGGWMFVILVIIVLA